MIRLLTIFAHESWRVRIEISSLGSFAQSKSLLHSASGMRISPWMVGDNLKCALHIARSNRAPKALGFLGVPSTTFPVRSCQIKLELESG